MLYTLCYKYATLAVIDNMNNKQVSMSVFQYNFIDKLPNRDYDVWYV